MSGKHISGQDFNTMVGNLLVHVDALSASITDNSTTTMTSGVPNGYVSGDVSCSGDIEVDTRNFILLTEAARAAGSFRDLEPFDIICVAAVGAEVMTIKLHDCLLKVSDLINIDPKGGEKSKYKIAFDVTGSDFVSVNGVSYLSDQDVLGLYE